MSTTDLEAHLAMSKMLTQQGDIIAERVGDALGARLVELRDEMEQSMGVAIDEAFARQAEAAFAKGLVTGVRMLLEEDKQAGDDSSTIKRFWKTGYRELTSTATKETSQWIGRKILIALVTAIFISSMVWLVKNNGIK